MPEIIHPTVGRRVWFRPNGKRIAGFLYDDEPTPSADNPLGEAQPCDAGICYVHGSGKTVNVTVADQGGVIFGMSVVPLIQAGERPPQRGTPYVEWMPYQQGQAKKQAARVFPKFEAPRVSLEQVSAQIASETYTVLPSGRVTICELVLRDGFVVIGHSAVVFNENFDAEIGRRVARDRAVDKIWELEGRALRAAHAEPR